MFTCWEPNSLAVKSVGQNGTLQKNNRGLQVWVNSGAAGGRQQICRAATIRVRYMCNGSRDFWYNRMLFRRQRKGLRTTSSGVSYVCITHDQTVL